MNNCPSHSDKKIDIIETTITSKLKLTKKIKVLNYVVNYNSVIRR